MDEELKQEGSQREDLERIDGYIEKLRLESEEDQPVSKALLKNKKSLFLVGGSVALLLSLFLGIFLIYKFLYLRSIPGLGSKDKDTAKVTPDSLSEEAPKTKEELKMSPKPQKEMSPFVKPPKRQEQALQLKNFLVSLDGRGFFKFDVYLYYDEHESLKKAQSEEFLLREAIFEFFTNRKDWDTKKFKDLRGYEDELRQHLKKRNLRVLPERIEVEGVILRS